MASRGIQIEPTSKVDMKLEDSRKEIRRIEQEIDSKLHSYTSLLERLRESSPNEDSINEFMFSNREHSEELASLLQKLFDRNRDLAQTNCATSVAQHHRSKLDDYTHEYKRLMKQANQELDRTQLLQGSKSGDTSVNMELLFRERGSVLNSSYMADDLLSQARATKQQLDEQNRSLLGSESKIKSASSQFPDIFQLMGRVRLYKWRNTLIIGSFIGLLTCLLIWYWFTR